MLPLLSAGQNGALGFVGACWSRLPKPLGRDYVSGLAAFLAAAFLLRVLGVRRPGVMAGAPLRCACFWKRCSSLWSFTFG